MTDADVKNKLSELYKANLSNAYEISKILTDNGCDDVLVLDIGSLCDLAQFFIIATTKSTTHTKNTREYQRIRRKY